MYRCTEITISAEHPNLHTTTPPLEDIEVAYYASTIPLADRAKYAPKPSVNGHIILAAAAAAVTIPRRLLGSPAQCKRRNH